MVCAMHPPAPGARWPAACWPARPGAPGLTRGPPRCRGPGGPPPRRTAPPSRGSTPGERAGGEPAEPSRLRSLYPGATETAPEAPQRLTDYGMWRCRAYWRQCRLQCQQTYGGQPLDMQRCAFLALHPLPIPPSPLTSASLRCSSCSLASTPLRAARSVSHSRVRDVTCRGQQGGGGTLRMPGRQRRTGGDEGLASNCTQGSMLPAHSRNARPGYFTLFRCIAPPPPLPRTCPCIASFRSLAVDSSSCRLAAPSAAAR